MSQGVLVYVTPPELQLACRVFRHLLVGRSAVTVITQKCLDVYLCMRASCKPIFVVAVKNLVYKICECNRQDTVRYSA